MSETLLARVEEHLFSAAALTDKGLKGAVLLCRLLDYPAMPLHGELRLGDTRYNG